MQIKEVTVERTFQISQYEPFKIVLSANVSEGDDIQKVIDSLYQECMSYRRSMESDDTANNNDSRGRRRK